MSSAKKIVDLATAVVFCAAISLPVCAGAILRFPADTATENRPAASFPATTLTSLVAFPRAFESWFADHLTFRHDLVRGSGLLRLRIGVSPSPLVDLGKDGWLFFTGDHADDQFRHLLPFADNELLAWRWLLEVRRDWLTARGIHYLFVLTPNKQSVYPEVMPFPEARLPRPDRLEQLLDDLREHSSVSVLDTTFALEDARWAGQRVFHRTDSHWNGLGRYAAYSAIATRLHDWFEAVEPATIAEFDVKRYPGLGGDLSRLMGVPLDVREEETIEATPRKPRAKQVSVGPENYLPPMAYEVPDRSLPRVLVLGDSFIRGLVEPLAEHFQRTVYRNGHELTGELIAQEAPDIVIDGWVERFLMVGFLELPKDAQTSQLPLWMDSPHPRGVEIMPRESWQPHDVLLSGGGLAVAIGIDPWLLVQPTAFTATGTEDVWVALTASNNGPPSMLQAQFFFAAGGAELSEAASIRFSILADGRQHSYRVRPSLSSEWSGRIDLLRLDFPNLSPGNSYTVHSVELVEPEAGPRTSK